MNIISAPVPLENRDFTAHADLPNDLSCSLGYLPAQHLVAILGRSHKVVLDVIGRVRPFAIFRHSPSILGTRPHLAKAVHLKAKGLDRVHGTKGHSRIEILRCWAVADPVAFEYIRHHEGWATLQTIVRVQRERRLPDQVEQETAYYISSLPPQAALILDATCRHWAVENALHWVLDVTFREDESRLRKDNSPQNMAVLRHMALNILKRDTSKSSLR